MKSSSFNPPFFPHLIRLMGIALFLFFSGCQNQSIVSYTEVPVVLPTPVILPTLIASVTATPYIPATATTIPSATPTITPTPCAEAAGQVVAVNLYAPILGESIPAQVYLPPCYTDAPKDGYPLLLMLHGQGGDQFTWSKLGLVEAADRLIGQGEISPLVIVMPFEHHQWNDPGDTWFQQALINDVIPQIDEQFNLNPLPQFRAVGGYSRGANWAVRIGFTNPALFSSIGAHSYPTFGGDTNMVSGWIDALDPSQYPRLAIDSGADDYYLRFTELFEAELNRLGFAHEYLVQPGDHDATYWAAHVEDYLRWYAEGWQQEP